MSGLINSNDIFINENSILTNTKLAFHCGKVKRDGDIEKPNTRNGLVYIQHGSVHKILHITTLFNMFPDFHFVGDSRG